MPLTGVANRAHKKRDYLNQVIPLIVKNDLGSTTLMNLIQCIILPILGAFDCGLECQSTLS
jgi:hypothetical protein